MTRIWINQKTSVRLADGVELETEGLWDPVRGHCYVLNDSGQQAVGLFARGMSLGVVSEELAARYDQREDEVAAHLGELLEALNAAGLVVVRTRPSAAAVRTQFKTFTPTTALLALAAFDWPSSAVVRRRAAPSSIVRAAAPVMFAAFGAALVAMTVVGLALALTGAPGISKPTTLIALVVPLWALVGLAGSVVSHELGHLMALRRYYSSERLAVVSRGISISVGHPRIKSRPHAVIVAVAGPALALGFCAALAAAMVALAQPFYAVVALALGLSHLYSLVPWHDDGRMLWGRNGALD